jgi:hypothetical protein
MARGSRITFPKLESGQGVAWYSVVTVAQLDPCKAPVCALQIDEGVPSSITRQRDATQELHTMRKEQNGGQVSDSSSTTVIF